MTVRQNLEINQGANWSRVYTHASDLSGYTAAMQIKFSFSSGLQATPTLVINGSNITMSLTAVETAAMASGEFVYDLELTSSSGNVERALQGGVSVYPEVTGSSGALSPSGFSSGFSSGFW